MKKKKMLTSIFVIVLLSAICVLTYAFYIDKDEIINTADSADSKIEIVEEFPPPPDSSYSKNYTQVKEVKIKNIKDKSYVRCFLELSDENFSKSVQLNFSGDSNWVKEGEYWYYKLPLDTGEMTKPLLKSVLFKTDVAKNKFDIIVYAESVQAEGYDNYISAFDDIR